MKREVAGQEIERIGQIKKSNTQFSSEATVMKLWEFVRNHFYVIIGMKEGEEREHLFLSVK